MATLKLNKALEEKRDASIEQWLRGFGITTAEFKLVDLADINTKESRSNQARIEPLMEEHVERLRVAWQSGAVLPPLVANEQLVLLDGNHRHEALTREGVAQHLIYVVPANGQLFHDMAVAANTLHGQPNTDAERRLHAVQLSATGTYTFVQISAMVGLSVSQVSDAVHAAAVRSRIGSSGAVDRVPVGHLAMLDKVTADGPLRAAVEAVDACGAGQVATRQLVNELKKARSESAAYKLVEEFTDRQKAQRKESRTPRGKGPKDLATLRRAITYLRSVNPTKVSMEVNGSKDSLIADLGECVEKLSEIENAL